VLGRTRDLRCRSRAASSSPRSSVSIPITLSRLADRSNSGSTRLSVRLFLPSSSPFSSSSSLFFARRTLLIDRRSVAFCRPLAVFARAPDRLARRLGVFARRQAVFASRPAVLERWRARFPYPHPHFAHRLRLFAAPHLLFAHDTRSITSFQVVSRRSSRLRPATRSTIPIAVAIPRRHCENESTTQSSRSRCRRSNRRETSYGVCSTRYRKGSSMFLYICGAFGGMITTSPLLTWCDSPAPIN